MFHPLQWRPPSSIYAFYAHASRFSGQKGKPNLCQAEKSWKSRLQWLLTWLQKGSTKCPRQKSLLSLLANQCSYVTGQRVQRAQQIAQLYSNIYSERTRKSLFSSLWRKFQGRNSNACKLMAALTGVFLWEQERIKEEELRRWVSAGFSPSRYLGPWVEEGGELFLYYFVFKFTPQSASHFLLSGSF